MAGWKKEGSYKLEMRMWPPGQGDDTCTERCWEKMEGCNTSTGHGEDSEVGSLLLMMRW